MANTNKEAKEDDVDEANDEARHLVQPKPNSNGAQPPKLHPRCGCGSKRIACFTERVLPLPVTLTHPTASCAGSACFESLAEKAAEGLERSEFFLESLSLYEASKQERWNTWVHLRSKASERIRQSSAKLFLSSSG